MTWRGHVELFWRNVAIITFISSYNISSHTYDAVSHHTAGKRGEIDRCYQSITAELLPNQIFFFPFRAYFVTAPSTTAECANIFTRANISAHSIHNVHLRHLTYHFCMRLFNKPM